MAVKNGFESGRLEHPDGTLHHIGIDERSSTRSCILTSNLERTKIIADTFDIAQQVGDHREYITYRGEKHGRPLSVMSIGMGCMPTAIAVEELKHVGCTNLIKVGTCGAIQAGVEPGSIIVATGAVRGEGASIEYVNYQYPAVADLEVLTALIESAGAKGEEPIAGILRTHDALFLESPFAHNGMEERIKPWRDLGVVGIENEASSLLTVGSILGSKAGVICLAVDNYTDGTSMNFERDYEGRMATVIEIATTALGEIDRLTDSE
jgi:uridine phosphorylase